MATENVRVESGCVPLEWQAARTESSASDEPEEFLYRLFREVRLPIFEPLGLAVEPLEGMLRMQFAAMQAGYRQTFPNLLTQFLQDGAKLAGAVRLAEGEATIALVDITLLRAYQDRGLGSLVLRELQRRAALAGKGVTLNVADDNPRAKGLYERLGFRFTAKHPAYQSMSWLSVD